MEMLKTERLLELSFPVIQESLLCNLPINIFIANSLGYLAWGNPRMLKAVRETEESFVGKHLSSWGDNKWLACQRVIQTGNEESFEEEGPDSRYYLTNRKPIWHIDRNNIAGIIGVSLDITKIEQARRVKETFILNMNHDIRTPFSGIVGVFEILDDGESDLKKKEWIKIGLSSSTRLLNFMSDISQISQVGHLPLDYKIFDIIQMADDILLFLEATVKSKGLDVIRHYDGEMVCSNPFRIKHILLNLLGNAIKFTEKGGISLSIKTASNLVITVCDSGIGIDKDYHEKIFEECFKAKPSYKNSDYAGVGKGLYLVKNYVKDLQGKITVKSAASKGSTFIVEIPLGNSV